MTEREFWIAIRMALIAMIKAIEKKYKIGPHKTIIDELPDGDNVTRTPPVVAK